jgi:hypothetical protein
LAYLGAVSAIKSSHDVGSIGFIACGNVIQTLGFTAIAIMMPRRAWVLRRIEVASPVVAAAKTRRIFHRPRFEQ